MVVTPDGQRAISASGEDDHTLKVWDLASGRGLASFIGEGHILCCAVSPDGRTILAGERTGRLHFLRLEGCDE